VLIQTLAVAVLLLLPFLVPSLVQAADSLVVYSGRAERLIKPVLDAFQAGLDQPHELVDGVFGEVGQGPLSGLFRRGDEDLIYTPRVGEEVQFEAGKIQAMLPKPGVRDVADPWVIGEAMVAAQASVFMLAPGGVPRGSMARQSAAINPPRS
jgi:hypothetical protein